MIRLAMLGCLTLALGAAADEKNDAPKELAPFQGTWKVVEASRGGMPAPKGAVETLTFTFEGTKLIASEKGKDETASVTVDPKKEPATIDMITPKNDKVLGIYKFDKDGRLTLCFLQEKGAARPKGFDEKEAAVLVLEKVKK